MDAAFPAGHRLVRLASTGSTNAVAADGVAAGELHAGDVVVADDQTAGRGRRGRSWRTLPGRSLAASVITAPPRLARPGRLSLLSGVAAARALARLGVDDVAIKWPNDLMRGERKIGGLLLETATAPDGRGLLVVGLGVNLASRPGDFPPDLADLAGDAGLDPGQRDRLLAAFVEELDAALAGIGTPSDAERGAELRRRSWLTGRRVVLRHRGETRAARVADVTPEGDLVLDDGRALPGELVELVSVAPDAAG